MCLWSRYKDVDLTDGLIRKKQYGPHSLIDRWFQVIVYQKHLCIPEIWNFPIRDSSNIWAAAIRVKRMRPTCSNV